MHDCVAAALAVPHGLAGLDEAEADEAGAALLLGAAQVLAHPLQAAVKHLVTAGGGRSGLVRK